MSDDIVPEFEHSISAAKSDFPPFFAKKFRVSF